MANVYLQQGDLQILDLVRLDGNVWTELKLFQNDHVPDVTDVDADYTEATFSGYAAVALGAWNSAFVNTDGQGQIDADPAAFTHNGGGTSNTIYGAYVVDDTGSVQYAERFDAPRVMASNGDTIPYIPRITLVSA